MRPYLDLFTTLIKNNLSRQLFYRANAIMITLSDLIWAFVELGFFQVIYSNITAINEWTKEQSFFFFGVYLCVDTLFAVFFQRSFWYLPYTINNGELDVFLTKPVNTLFLVTVRDINFTQGLNLILGIYLISHFSYEAGFQGGLYWLWLPVWMVIGLATQFLIRLFFVLGCFWLERGLTLSRLYYEFLSLANKPEVLYPKWVRLILKSILPFAIIGSVPTRHLLGQTTALEIFGVFCALGLYALLCTWIWKRGLMRYQSASS